MGDRYFPATVMGGRLYLDVAGKTASLNAERPAYCDEAVADMLVARAGHRKARTWTDLDEAVKESGRGLPAVRIWILEGLWETAWRLWEESVVSELIAERSDCVKPASAVSRPQAPPGPRPGGSGTLPLLRTGFRLQDQGRTGWLGEV